MKHGNKIFLGLEQRNFLISLFALSLVLRFAYFIFLRVYLKTPIVDDEGIYFSYAANLANSWNYFLCGAGKAYFSPGYPLTLFPFFKIFGSSIIVGGIVNVFISSLIPIVVYFMARNLFNVRCAVYAALISAFYPYYIYYSPRLLSETSFTLLLLCGLFALIKAKDEKSALMAALAGLLLGFACLTRPVLLLFPVIVVLYFLLKRNFRPGVFIRLSILFLIAFFLVLAPWALRNNKVLGKPILSNTNTGKTLFGSNHFLSSRTDKNMGIYSYDASLLVKERSIDYCPLSEIDKDELLLSLTLAELKDNQSKIPFMLYKKFINFWHIKPDPSRSYWNRHDTLSLFSYGLLLIFFIIGFFKTFKPKRNAFIIHLSIFYFTSMALISWGTPRFRLPISPLIIILATAILSGIWVSFSSKLNKST